MKCREIIDILEQLSPVEYACEWDNVGLLVGRKEKEIRKIMIALDASKEVISIAVREQVDMLITHHPMIFSSIKKVNEEQFTTSKVLTLAENGICYYAMHTNFDTIGGMAELAAGEKYLNLSDTFPIEPEECGNIGMGRYGKLPKAMTAEQADRICEGNIWYSICAALSAGRGKGNGIRLYCRNAGIRKK